MGMPSEPGQPWEFFGNWKLIEADDVRGVVALETAIRGTCTHRLLDLTRTSSATGSVQAG